jgi:hypothetical protein
MTPDDGVLRFEEKKNNKILSGENDFNTLGGLWVLVLNLRTRPPVETDLSVAGAAYKRDNIPKQVVTTSFGAHDIRLGLIFSVVRCP